MQSEIEIFVPPCASNSPIMGEREAVLRSVREMSEKAREAARETMRCAAWRDSRRGD